MACQQRKLPFYSQQTIHLSDALLSPSDMEVSIVILFPRHKQAHQIVVHSKAVIDFIQIYILPLHKQIQYGLVAILQFSMGKIYEVVVFGSVGSIILEHTRKKRQ